MNVDSPAAAPTEVFLGRQPVLDRNHELVGYELMFRAAARGEHGGDPRAVTADIVCDAFAELGLSHVLGRSRAFIAVDADFLGDAAVEMLPSDLVIFALERDALHHAETVARCRELRGAGFEFAITGVVGDINALGPLLDIATFLKVDIGKLGGPALQALAGELRTTRRTLIATGVASTEQMELCAMLGFELFQGYFFANVEPAEGGSLDASARAIFQLTQLLAEDADVGQLEQVLRGEPGLVVNLLRLTNSVGVGARVKIGSVRHAISVLGRRALQRWLQLLLFRHGGAKELQRNPLMQYAALRGRYMELLAERLHPGAGELKDEAFITGLMSVMPAALKMSMTDILAQIALDREVRLALSRKEGALGRLLAITEAYDDNDVDALRGLIADAPGFEIGTLGEILAAALGWVQQLDTPAE